MSAPHHPQTLGKLKCVHETLKGRLNLLVYTSPEVLRAAMAAFIRLSRAVPREDRECDAGRCV